jgi:hypothetical protein
MSVTLLAAFAVRERDVTIFHRADAVIGNGHAEDIAAQILQRGHAVARGLRAVSKQNTEALKFTERTTDELRVLCASVFRIEPDWNWL